MDRRADERSPTGWVLVLPVKDAAAGKSRLVAPPDVDRVELARAIALDSLAAVRACRLVHARVVVTSDALVATDAAAAGDDVRPDPGDGLREAVEDGLTHAVERWPGLGWAVLLPDVPALQPHELASALAAAGGHHQAFVPDHQGSGTVLLTGGPGVAARASFGDGSAGRHELLGAVPLPLDLPTLRRDVDTIDDLRVAQALGLGPATAALLHRSGVHRVH